MKRSDLIVGEAYLLEGRKNVPAIFRGERKGTWATMQTPYGEREVWVPAALEFDTVKPDGTPIVALLDTGREIEEPVATRDKRQKVEAERRAREEAVAAAMLELLTAVGLAPEGPNQYSMTPKIRSSFQIERCVVDDIPWARLEPVLRRAMSVHAEKQGA